MMMIMMMMMLLMLVMQAMQQNVNVSGCTSRVRYQTPQPGRQLHHSHVSVYHSMDTIPLT